MPASRLVFGDGTLSVLNAPAAGTLTVRSRIAPARNVALEGLYVSSGVFCTQCEPEGFRRITYFPDRPDVLARYTVTIRADRSAYPVLLSNGNLVAQGVLDGNRHFTTWHDPHPKPSYLFALVAGELSALEDSFTTMSGRKVALRIYSTPRNLPRCHHAMQSLKRSFRWDEERFGREYDLDAFMIFCADDFNMGAMENKGLNIFNSRLVLADPDTATDDDYSAIEAVIGHEYFHNWTGNRVTCRDWFQLSLKEGLTVFRDQEFSSDLNSRAVERIASVEFLRREQFAEDAGPMAHTVRPDEYLEINNFYTSTVYEKGAEVIRMQHTLLGAERFRKGMDLYFRAPRRTGGDLRRLRAGDAGRVAASISPVQALVQPGRHSGGRHPGHATTPRRGPTRSRWRNGRPPTPGQPDKAPLHIPLAVGLVGTDGRDIPLKLEGEAAPVGTTRVLDLREARQPFRFTDIPECPVPSLLRGFSAPVTVQFDYSADELAFLAAHDSDAVNRWDAAQKSFVNAILAVAGDARAGHALVTPPALTRVVRTLLADRASDPALIALALIPPDPAYVASLESTIDVDGVTRAREFLIAALAGELRGEFERVYAERRIARPTRRRRHRLGRASLRNVACAISRASTIPAGPRGRRAVRRGRQHDRCDRRARRAQGPRRAPRHDCSRASRRGGMTSRWCSTSGSPSRHGPARRDALDRVRELLRHPRFNARNPNRVRSLVGAFTLRNFARFNAIDGSGYAFAADQVLTLDGTNPQLASTIAGAFNLWKRFPEPSRAVMQAALQRIATAPGLSPDVTEVVTRTLAD